MALTEEEIKVLHDESVQLFGADHTHDLDCRIWRTSSVRAACDCTLPERKPGKDASDLFAD